MPVMPGYANADTPHTRTVHLASQGWRYGCHSARTGDSRPRGITTRNAVPLRVGVTADERFPAGELLIVATAEVRSTDWLPIPCGHTTRAADAACEGCVNRRTE